MIAPTPSGHTKGGCRKFVTVFLFLKIRSFNPVFFLQDKCNSLENIPSISSGAVVVVIIRCKLRHANRLAHGSTTAKSSPTVCSEPYAFQMITLQRSWKRVWKEKQKMIGMQIPRNVEISRSFVRPLFTVTESIKVLWLVLLPSLHVFFASSAKWLAKLPTQENEKLSVNRTLARFLSMTCVRLIYSWVHCSTRCYRDQVFKAQHRYCCMYQ